MNTPTPAPELKDIDEIIKVTLSGIEKPIIINIGSIDKINLIKDKNFTLVHNTRDWCVYFCLDNNRISLGRYLLNITDPKLNVDHRNHDQYDFTDDNLRVATETESSQNRRKFRSIYGMKCTSRFKGVYWKKFRRGTRCKWASQIRVDGKAIHLGYFDIEELAALEYNSAAFKYFGEFACLNDFSHLVL